MAEPPLCIQLGKMAGEGIKLGLKLELPAVLLGEITTPTLKEETPGTQLHSHPPPPGPHGS